MKRIYDHMCKNCWHSWKSYNKYTVCPKCKSKNIDIKSEMKED
jgi:Zn finger protein HypA/HybF involved in hydrogenase expression